MDLSFVINDHAEFKALLENLNLTPQQIGALLVAGCPPKISKNTLRQRRFRERKKRYQSVTKRYDVTPVTLSNADVTPPAEIIKQNQQKSAEPRNASVTENRGAHISYIDNTCSYVEAMQQSKIIESKEVSKKDARARKRAVTLPDNWQPPSRAFQIALGVGVDVLETECIFRDYLKSSGKLYLDYDAAFCNFVRNQRRFNGNNHHGKTPNQPNPRSGSLIAAIDRALEKSIAEDAAAATPENSLFSFPRRSICGP